MMGRWWLQHRPESSPRAVEKAPLELDAVVAQHGNLVAALTQTEEGEGSDEGEGGGYFNFSMLPL